MRTLSFLLMAFLTSALLSGCGGRGGHPYGIPAQFDDVKPVRWRGDVPSNYPVHGVDVSRYQGDINWRQASASGVSFAFIKATEGGEIADPMFRSNWQATAAAGVPRGAYHFYYFCRTGAEQANWFIQHVPVTPGALPPVLDIEWTHSRSCPNHPDPAAVRAQVLDFLNIVGATYGQAPIIYTSVDFWQDNELWLISGYPFWLRSVAAHPRDIYDGHHWTFWQYTGTGLAPGFHGQVDLNAFAGSQSDWQNWLATHQL